MILYNLFVMSKLWFLIFLKRLFYIDTVNENNKIYKKINLLGFCFNYRDLVKELDFAKNQLSYLEQKTNDLSKENNLLRIFIERSIDIKQVPVAKGNRRKVQLIKTKLLELVAYVLKQNNITFWLDYGTLIGSIRHSGFIPWDDDIDVSFLKDDYLKLPKIFEDFEKIDEKFKFTYERWNSNIFRFSYLDFCVDFFPFEYINKKYETQELADKFIEKWYKIKELFLTTNPSIDYSKTEDVISKINYAKQKILGKNYYSNPESEQIIYSPEIKFVCNKCAILNANNIFPLKEGKFENLLFPVPNNPIEHLFEHKIYGNPGDVMNFPKISDSGFDHTQSDYENSNINYDCIYKELSDFTENYIKVTK